MSATTSTSAIDANAASSPPQRSLRVGDHAALWLSLSVGLLVLQSGALIAPALGFGQSALVIILGSALGVAVLGAVAAVAARQGTSAMACLAPVLGPFGVKLPAAANMIQLIGWGAFELMVMAQAAQGVTDRAGVGTAYGLWVVVFAVLVTALAYAGPLAFVRRVLRRMGIWLVLASALWLTWRLVTAYDLDWTNRSGDGSMHAGAALDVVIAMPLSWLPLAGDYARHVQCGSGAGRDRGRAAGWSAAAGYLVGTVWFHLLGAGYALALGDSAIVPALLAAAGGVWALGLILFGESDNAMADVYSAGVSSEAVAGGGPRLSWRVLLAGAAAGAIALVAGDGSYETFLLLLGSIFAPLYAVALTHWAGRTSTRPWAALIAWVLGVATYHLLPRWQDSLGATIPSMAVAALTYGVLAYAVLARQPSPGREAHQ